MGSSCVRDCERTAHELYTNEDSLMRQSGLPGLHGANASADASGMMPNGGVKVGRSASNPLSLIRGGPGAALQDGRGGESTSAVPRVENWLQVAASSGVPSPSPRETPRFDEVTPRGSGPSDSRLGGTPGPSPRDSPRPPDEHGRPSTSDAPASARVDEISYEGTYLGSMKHGTGRLRMNGSVYEGDFRQDLKHGNGVLTWDDGRQYRGNFQDGKFHGSAVMTWPDGRKYCGEYIEDRKHGEGTFSWQDGRRYQGQWVVGKRHGIGVYTNAKGLTRTGTWNMDRPLHWEQAVTAPPGRPAQAAKETVKDTLFEVPHPAEIKAPDTLL